MESHDSGTFKEEDGTGLGDGDTSCAHDVSKQIENEDQIMGARQQQEDVDDQAVSKEDGHKGDDEVEQEGIEMQQDFDGVFDDNEKDAPQDLGDEEVCCARSATGHGHAELAAYAMCMDG